MADIVWLAQAGAFDPALVGGKAANLSALMAAGFDVPSGFVVTTQAYHRRNPDGSVPASLADEIRMAWRDLAGDGATVAVRSSATAEDLAGASFAGQQETYLQVAGEDAVVAAVADCWASLYSERAVAYRRQQGIDETGLGIAVIVQLMVAARAAGVMFTADPLTGRRREAVITATHGLGDAVVSGTVNPDTFVIDTRDWEVLAAAAGETSGGLDGPTTLTAAQAVELARLGAAIEEHFGLPQDIEWALDASAFRVLQTRPITALPDPVSQVADLWPTQPGSLYFRASIVEQLPNPLTPLFADLMEHAVPAGLQALMDDLARTLGRRPGSLSGLDIGFPTINGYAFYRYARSALAAVTGASLPAVALLFARGGEFFLRRWREEGLPQYRAAVRVWAERDPASLAPADLLDGVADLLGAGCRYYTHVQTVIPLAGMAELSWRGLYRTLAGAPREPVEAYLLGLDSAPIEAEKRLWRLGRWVLDQPGLAAALTASGTDPAGEAPAGVAEPVWQEWRDRFAGYLTEFGHTTYDLDFIHPVPADDPAPILQALRFVLRGEAVDPFARQDRLALARDRATTALLAGLDPARRRLAGATLAWARSVVPAREDALAAIGLAWPVMRRLLAELGRRLAEEGRLPEPHDVFWLTADEARRLAAGESLAGLAELIAERQALHRGRQLLHPPQYLPVNRWMSLWDRFLPARVNGAAGDVLKGNAGSGGVVTGQARVIGGPADFGDFAPGEILVADITTPAYTPLFAVAGGVVTDIGGVLSHGSIVAREYGIPAVLGTGSATHRIRTGDTVTVDGGRGEVRLDGAEPAQPERDWAPWLAGGVVATAATLWVLRRRRR